MSTLMWSVVAREDDPARAGWTRAAREADVPQPRFVPWSAVVESEAEFRSGELVFVERLHPRTAANPVGGHRKRYEQLRDALALLDSAIAKAGALATWDAETVLLTLDRTRRDEFLSRDGVPVLEAQDPGSGPVADTTIVRPRFAGSDEWLIDDWHTQLFTHRTRGGSEVWRSPGEVAAERRWRAQLIDLLADDGIHVVPTLHRVYLASSFFDIRFAVVDGKATHAAGVPREKVIAREWYGGRRRELDVFLERFGPERWQRLVLLAERTAACFPGMRALGVDLIMDNHEAEYVFDVDPFGAYLPGHRGGLAGGMPNVAGEAGSARAAVLRSLKGVQSYPLPAPGMLRD